MFLQFVVIIFVLLHRFNFARKPDKKYCTLLHYYNSKAGGRRLIWLQCQPEPELEPRVKPFFNWRSKSIVHSWLYFEHHFFTSLSEMSPTKPDFAKSGMFSVVPSSRTQCGSKIKGGSILSVNTLTMVSGTLHFDLFAIICFFAQGLLAL